LGFWKTGFRRPLWAHWNRKAFFDPHENHVNICSKVICLYDYHGFGSSSSRHELHSGQTVNPGRLVAIKSLNFGGSKYSPFVESYHSVHDEICQVSQNLMMGNLTGNAYILCIKNLLYGFQMFPVEFPCNLSIACWKSWFPPQLTYPTCGSTAVSEATIQLFSDGSEPPDVDRR
jgi:hypothetical protein